MPTFQKKLMELLYSIQNRSSVRTFKSDPVPELILREMVRRAGMAPSINNSQPWQFIAITKNEVLREMAELVRNKINDVFSKLKNEKHIQIKDTVIHFSTFFENAPTAIVVASKPYEAVIDKIASEAGLSHAELDEIRNHPKVMSIGAAIQNLLLSAVDLGYEACWASGFMIAKKEVEKLLDIKTPFELNSMIIVGKRDEPVKFKARLPIEEIYRVI